jgi:hypothetical protein
MNLNTISLPTKARPTQEYLQKHFANGNDVREREREMDEELGIFFWGGKFCHIFSTKKVEK